jgi:hypothetical protein
MAQPKLACINCHFFVKYSNSPSGKHIINKDERKKIREGEVSRDFGLCCDFGVWDEGFNFDKTKIQEILLKKDRQDFCFYWAYRPNMLTPAAKILQERETINRETSRERRLTILGLWIAALALVVDVFLRIVEFMSTP